MEIEHCENVEYESKVKEQDDHKDILKVSETLPEEFLSDSLPSSVSCIAQSVAASSSIPTEISIIDNEITTEIYQQSPQNEPQQPPSDQSMFDSEFPSTAQSVFSFEQFSNPCITKRGRGRPRKDGRSPVQQNKMLRGRGRPKREDSSSILHHKIFPGRPRLRTKKLHRHLFMASSSHLIRQVPIKEELNIIRDNTEPVVSGDSSIEMKSIIPEPLPLKLPGLTRPKKTCSFCNLVETSCLGQGKLKSFKPTPGFTHAKFSDQPLFTEEKQLKPVSERKDQIKILFKKHRSLKTGQEQIKLKHKSLHSQHEKSILPPNPAEELVNIGFNAPPEIKNIFQTSGDTYAHLNCAVWSEGVSKVENEILNVDKAVLNGMFQKCSRCEKYGATIKCNIGDCDRVYHYPCAILSGALQNVKSYKIVCSSHLDMATDFETSCNICKTTGNLSDFVLCALCTKHYHANCLDPPVDLSTAIRAGWQCVECKICQTCRQTGDENKMLVCDLCDKGYHTFCLKPTIITVPKSGWKCHDCRVCGDCGARTPGNGPSSRWHLNYTVCDSCYQQRNKGVACPLCGKAYRQFSQKKEMKHCCVCRKYIHVECDKRTDQIMNPLDYVCPICVNPVEVGSNPDISIVDHSLKAKLQDSNISVPEIFLCSSRDSFTSGNEESFSSAESDSTSDLGGGKLAGKRRAKTAEFRQKKSPKPKIRSYPICGTLCLPSAIVDPKEYKTEDDDPSTDNKMVLSSATDEYVLCQDLCVMCGSFGKTDEGRLIACSQCGQCYHSYCVSVKLTAVILKKGWRCLDCTVCEGCGQPHDEGRLLLCDECDISFHIYCLDPPLKEVPKGNWKCKWCVICIKCGTRAPGYNCNWQINYTHCGPCASFTTCPMCIESYEENDLIIQCTQCERWSHGKCDEIETEESAEKCADYGYICALCRPSDEPPPHLLPPPCPPTPEPEPVPEKPPTPPPKTKEPETPAKVKPPVQFFLDGVYLSESGLQYIKSLTPEQPKKVPRPRKPRQSSVGTAAASQVVVKYPSVSGFDESEATTQIMQGSIENTPYLKPESEIKQEIDDEVRGINVDLQKDLSTEAEKKKRPRKIQKLGIGGFAVKPRGRSSSTKETTAEPGELVIENQMQGEVGQTPVLENTEQVTQDKPKRRRKPKKKTPLEESFPSYLRDAFFGKDLLTACKKGSSHWDIASQEDFSTDNSNLNQDKVLSSDLPKTGHPPSMPDATASVADNSINLRLAEGATKVRTVSAAGKEHVVASQNINVQNVKNMLAMSSNITSPADLLSALNSNKQSVAGSLLGKEIKTERLSIKDENSLSFDAGSTKTLTSLEETCGLPQMDSKDVEDVFEGVLRDQAVSQTSQLRIKETLGSRTPSFPSGSNSPIHISQLQNTGQFGVQRSGTQLHAQSSPVHRENIQGIHHQDSNSSWSESECGDHSQMQKNILKWESDEPLGLLSTISPVLYANINYPHLKMEYPSWSDRVKQIAKIWRSLPSEKRQPYLQRARDNRAVSRTQKSNQDQERGTKDVKVQEIDQEKQWKQFQALRQLQQQKQQRILQEHRAQDKGGKGGHSRSLSDIPQATRTDHPQDSPTCAKDIAYGKIYGKKWGSETSVGKQEELSSPQILTQLPQGKPEMSPTLVRSPNQGRPPPVSPFIQVSRVRPPIDPNRITVGEPASLQGSPSGGTSAEHYTSTQSILTPHGLPQQHRSSYSPSSPASRQSLLLSRTEISRAPTPTLSKEVLYTPPSTPRPQSSDSFFQGAVSPRAQFLISMDSHSQPALTTHKIPNAPSFQAGNVSPGTYSAAPNISTYSSVEAVSSISSQITEVTSSKPFYSQSQVSSVMQNKPTNQPQIPTPIDPSSKCQTKMSSSEHFVHQQSIPVSPIEQNIPIPKQVMQYKDDIYAAIPGTPRPSVVTTTERAVPHHAFEQIFDDSHVGNSDPNKLMARHQLRELLQKQHGNKPDENVLQISSKDANQIQQQWQQGVYNAAALQFLGKDDCFRHPYPPAVRTRNLSAKDIKPEHSPDVLAGSPGDLKLDLLPVDVSPRDDKSSIHSSNNLISTNLSLSQHPDASNNMQATNLPDALGNAGKKMNLSETSNESKRITSCEDSIQKGLQNVKTATIRDESSGTTAFLPEESKEDVSSPGVGKKRKTTAGDLVKDLEAQPEEHDVIASGCNLDVLTGDVGELELDDDELLGLGNDFNILEYADPELDKGLVGEGEKSNILDEHLDLDDKDDELEADEEEIKAHTNTEVKDLLPSSVPGHNKKEFCAEEVDKMDKDVQKCEPADLHDDFLEFEKKEEAKNKLEAESKMKNIECNTEKATIAETASRIKKEAKLSFSSCSLSSTPFCAQEDLNLKSEMMTIKEPSMSHQPAMSFNSAIQNLASHPPVPAYSQQIAPPPSYRIGNVMKQNLTPTSPHLQQNPLLSPHRNVFPLHVGVPLRPSLPVVQQTVISNSQQNKPLLLQEQPLLLEDLVEQEKREQRRQTQEGLISPQGDALLSDIDFERLKDDVFSGPPDDSIGGPGSLLGSHEPSLQTVVSPSTSVSSTNSGSSHGFGPPPYSLIWQNQDHNMSISGPPRTPAAIMQAVQQKAQVPNVINSLGLSPGILLHGEPSVRAPHPQKSPTITGNVPGHFASAFLSTPPSPPTTTDPHTEQERQKIIQYEKFLLQQQTILNCQQKYFETEVIKLRKIKKALNAKQRQLRKNGSELAENDASELAKVSAEQAGLQKQLDQVRKQTRQHGIALQDYRAKHQKRQQQQIPHSPIHASISSLQSSPQNSHSPHQISQAAPQSPMLPSSPMKPSPSAARIQHSTSPLLHHSPAAVSPTVIQQPSPLVHSHLLSQQMSLHFTAPKIEGKAWSSPLQVSQIADDSIQHSERSQQRELIEKNQSGQPAPMSSVGMNLEQVETKVESQLKPDQDTFKRFSEQPDTPTIASKVDEQNAVLKASKVETCQGNDQKSDTNLEVDSAVPQSILAQSLPSSVTNTLNFTLRQTGMPTVCLPTAVKSSSDDSTQVRYMGLSPSEKISVAIEQKTLVSEPRMVREPVSGKRGPPDNLYPPDDIEENSKTENEEHSMDGHRGKPSSVYEKPVGSKVEQTVFNFDIALKKEGRNPSFSNDCSFAGHQSERKESDVDSQDGNRSSSKETSTCNLQNIDSDSLSKFQARCRGELNNQQRSVSNNQINKDNEKQGLMTIKLECKDVENTHSETEKMLIAQVKKELESCEDEQMGSVIARTQHAKNDNNEGSSDEELENLTKTAAAADEGDHDPGKQNVLLKQLLQNCPSAETSRKADTFIELKKEDTKVEEVPFDINKDSADKRLDDAKTKKPSYLDIRRAQLEKEPTPPPGEAKAKPPKRKRPKKKKPDAKDGSPVKKKCRKGSSSKVEEGYETYIETLMTQLTNLPPVRILEPNIKPNFNVLSAFGSGDLNAKERQLKGSYGNSLLPNQCDIYSYYPYGKNHATPAAVLPPSPPYRGFYNQEFPPLPKGKIDASTLGKPPLQSELQKVFRDAESPDTVISSSSPECCLFEPLCKWPELIFIDHTYQGDDDKKSYSPVIPLIAPIPIRFVPCSWNESAILSEYDKEKDKENIPRSESKSDISLLKNKITGLGGYAAPLKDSGNVAVTLTLSSAAAEDICGVLSALADLLKIPIPASYDIVERTATPPSQKLGLYRKSKNCDVNIHSLLNGKPRFCRHCDIVVLSAGIRKKASDLTCISKEEQEEDEVIFCSTNCYMQFALTHRSSSSGLEDKEAAAIVSHPSDKNSKGDKNENMHVENMVKSTITEDRDPSEISAESVKMEDISERGRSMSSEETPMEISETDVVMAESIQIKTEKNLNEESMIFGSDIDNPDFKDEQTMDLIPKRWKSIRYKYWSPASTNVQKYKSNKDDAVEKTLKSFYHTIKPNLMPRDSRRCIFCHAIGDSDTYGSARLLNIDVDKWAHLNCALWSAEVYETVNGALMNVETAYKRACMLVCCSCHMHGASLKCFKVRCGNIYHFACAMKEHCIFFKDKTLLCPQHTNKGNIDNELDSVAVFRRVYINRDEHKHVASMIQGDQFVMRIGSLIFLNIGQLLPQQIQAFHTPNCIYPVGYKVIRMYWSMRKVGRRCQYICSINEVNGKPEFNIQVKELDHKDIVLKDKTAKGVWQKVLYPIEKMRRQAKTIKIFPDFISGDDLFGLTEPAVLRIVESLPGVDTLHDYNFRYGRSPFLELPLAINPTGCARSEPKLRTHFKRSHTLHTSNSTRSSFHSTFGGIEASSPYIKQFVHSKSSQYRKMKIDWRNNVYLARSRIQGLGLYAARDIEKHTMVIEYIGQLIRNEIAERNEAIYDAQNRGVYMFRLDENRVIDATLSGGLARYMNHSCNPNCVAEVVQIDRENKILIIANRRITRGEELSYDYKFEVEDDSHKIACLCGAPNCRKWMN